MSHASQNTVWRSNRSLSGRPNETSRSPHLLPQPAVGRTQTRPDTGCVALGSLLCWLHPETLRGNIRPRCVWVHVGPYLVGHGQMAIVHRAADRLSFADFERVHFEG